MTTSPDHLTEVSTTAGTPPARLADCNELYRSFIEIDPKPEDLYAFACHDIDFRKGRSRENTPWEEGVALSTGQKEATIKLADKWTMLRTTFPQQPFDSLVVLGAHAQSLRPRMNHAAEILMAGDHGESLVLLSCYRPTLTQEKAGFSETEFDLAIKLAEEDFNGQFMPDSFSCWEDLTQDNYQAEGEYAVAALGRSGTLDVTAISGSVPGGSARATTESTLMALQSLLSPSTSRLLFVTTALHTPYQKVQIERILPEFDNEIVGIEYPNLANINPDSEDYKFRIVLQEIGATIKNLLSSTQEMEMRTSTSI